MPVFKYQRSPAFELKQASLRKTRKGAALDTGVGLDKSTRRIVRSLNLGMPVPRSVLKCKIYNKLMM